MLQCCLVCCTEATFSSGAFCVCALAGCPPLQGSEGGQENFIGVLEKAMKLANQDPDEEGDDDEDEGPSQAPRVGGRKKKLPELLSCNQEN